MLAWGPSEVMLHASVAMSVLRQHNSYHNIRAKDKHDRQESYNTCTPSGHTILLLLSSSVSLQEIRNISAGKLECETRATQMYAYFT